jgi:TP901 family phage tail tape measure protein
MATTTVGGISVPISADLSQFDRDLARLESRLRAATARSFRVAMPAVAFPDAIRAIRAQAKGVRDAALAEARGTINALRATLQPAGGGVDWSVLLNRAGFRTAARALQVQGAVGAARDAATAGLTAARARGRGGVESAEAQLRAAREAARFMTQASAAQVNAARARVGMATTPAAQARALAAYYAVEARSRTQSLAAHRAVANAEAGVDAARARATAGMATAAARGQAGVARAVGDARTFWKTEAVAAAGKLGATLLRAGVGFGSLLARGSASVVSGVASAVASLAKGLASAATSFVESLLSGVKNLGLAGVGAGIGGAAFSAREAMSMESREVALRRATGLGPEANAGLMGKLKGMGGTMPGVGLEDVFGTATMGARLGVAGPQLELFTKDMLRLRTVFDETDMPLAEATTALARLAQLFGTGYQAMDKFAATLIRLDNLSSASARDILDIAARFGGTLSTFKVAASDSLALAAALREAGVPLETAATSISQIIQRMVSLKDIGTFARTAGMGRREFEGQVRADPIKALMSVVHGLGQSPEGAAIKGVDPIAASRQLEKMHLDGQRVRGTLLALTRVEEKLNELLKEGRDEWATTAHFLDAVAAKAGITESQLTLMWNRIKLLAAEIGAGLLPVLKGFSEGIGGLAAELKGFFEAQRGQMEAWGMRVGRTLGYVKLLWREWPTFVQLAWIKTQEFGERVATVMDRVGKVIRNAFEMAFDFVVDAVPKVATFIGESFVHSLSQAFRIRNPFLDMLIEGVRKTNPLLAGLMEAERNKGAGPGPVPPDFGKFDPARIRERLMRGVGPQGMFGGLPDRGLDVMAQQKHLEGARAAMEGAAAGAAGAGDAEDAVARAAGERAKKAEKFKFGKFKEDLRRKDMSPAKRAQEDMRKQRAAINAQVRRQRNAFNAAMRPGRRRKGAAGFKGAPPPGEAPMPAPGKPPKVEETDKQIEAMKAVTTAMVELLGGIRDIQRTGVAALFG